MPDTIYKVTFMPCGKSAQVEAGTTLPDAAAKAGVRLDVPCGGYAVCGKCKATISPAPRATNEELRLLDPAELAKGIRLACRVLVQSDLEVTPLARPQSHEHLILSEGQAPEVPLKPSVIKHYLRLTPPTLGDYLPDAERLCAAIPRHEIDHAVLPDLPEKLRQKNFEITAVAADGRIIAVEPGDTCRSLFGLAYDVGTTTVVGFLVVLATGAELAVASRTNPQIAYGDDVVTRIHHARIQEGLQQLQDSIRSCMNEIAVECAATAGISSENIYEAVIAGNTTMTHLFLGVSPKYIAEAPYVAGFRQAVAASARETGLAIHPNADVRVLPNVAGFVGSDTVGVALASGLHESSDPALAVDIGTNGEMIIGNRERMIACSTAAGPAFEGSRIKFGMRAAAGAIDRIELREELRYSVIGEVKPKGLCGTALIDIVAELLRAGVINDTGRLLPPEELPKDAERWKHRIVEGEKGIEFVIVTAAESALGRAITLTQRDVRELQLAKAAIAAGCKILMSAAGVDAKTLPRLFLAGAFGNYIRPENAVRIGLLPKLPLERISFIGNAAGAGARIALKNRESRLAASEIAKRIEYLELAARPDFQEQFAEAMMFSQTD